MTSFFAHKSPTPEPEDDPLPPREPEPDEEDPAPHPDPVLAPLPAVDTRRVLASRTRSPGRHSRS